MSQDPANTAKKRILFVDDEPAILECFKILLDPMKDEWDTSFLTNGQDALDLMEKIPIDVIISDMKMPGMTGAQLLLEVMERYPQTVRFILSGYAEQEAVAQCVGAAHQFLMKPCDFETLKSALVRVCALDVFLHNEKLKALVTKMSVLPSLPTVYFKVLRELQSPLATTESIASVVSTDPAMTAKLLQLVNSAFFGISRRISNPAEAVQLLGLGTLRSLTLSIHAFRVFEQPNIQLQRIWHHSLQTGLAAKKIVRSFNGQTQMVEEAFIAGLLHDLGKLMFSTNYPAEYKRATNLACEKQIIIGLAEKEVFGANHAEIGAYLLGLWGLPASIVEGVALHHRPILAPIRTFSPLTAVHVANVFQHDLDNEPDGLLRSALDEDYLTELNLKEQLPRWREAVAGLPREKAA